MLHQRSEPWNFERWVVVRFRARIEDWANAEVVASRGYRFFCLIGIRNREANDFLVSQDTTSIRVVLIVTSVLVFNVKWVGLGIPQSSQPMCIPSQPTASATSMRSLIRSGTLYLFVIA